MRSLGAGCLALLLTSGCMIEARAADHPDADQIAAQLMAITPRAPNQTVEEEWDRPEITCTPIDARGVFYDEDEKVARRPRMQLEVNFAFGSAELTADAVELLDELAQALKRPTLADARFLMVGHTDAVGGDEANQRLSERRARAVHDYLVDVQAIAPGRLKARGCGEAVLVVPEDPRSPRNRRVEVVNAGP
jgi:outer membrane protein OmpA-like peptidoglycan-associated protein